MFKKILIAEDFDSCSIGMMKIAKELQISVVDQVFYCDDALLKAQRAIMEQKPYQLLISDLSFVSDYREQKLLGGEDLIQAVRKEQPSIKIIVFSIENRFHRIKSMFDKYKINGFVTKGRDDMKELKEAITAVYQNKTYISHNDEEPSESNVHEFSEYDINILKFLSQGFTQKQIELYFKEKDITPNSASSIEKRLAILRDTFGAKDTKQLLSIVIELGII